MPDLLAALPSYLRDRAEPTTLGPAPALLARPDGIDPAPLVLWMHGRTVRKEIDPGRYLRWLRAGIGVCAIDLPGHGDRYDAGLQQPTRTLEVVERMAGEIDLILAAALDRGGFDADRVAIGGMSAGGMATILRLCSAHPFRATSLEATTGSWMHQARREMFRSLESGRLAAIDPMNRLDGWREIPVQAFHARHDEWVDLAGQQAFLDALRARYADPESIELVVYERTGAPWEHAGFGTMSADAKDRQRDFFARTLEAAPG